MRGTKLTSLGQIPEAWEVCPIGSFATAAQYGLSIRGERTGTYPILRMNCQVDGRVVFDDLQYVNLDRTTFETFRLTPGDILFNRTNSYELVGRSALYDHDISAVFASYLIRLQVDESRVNPAYLNYLLNWDVAQRELKKLASRGVSQANINASRLKDFEVHLPTPNEQVQIARTLDRARALVDRETALVNATAKVKQSLLQELFTRGLGDEAQRETEIGPVPESWERVPISALGQIVTGNTPPTKDAANYIGGQIPFIAPGDIEHGSRIRATEKLITEQGLTHSRPISAGTTCFVCIGSTIGKVGYATASQSVTNQQINSIIPRDTFDSLYTFYLMTFWSEHIRKHASPSPVPILSKGAFAQIEVVTSMNAHEQQEIAQTLDAIDRKIDLHRRKRAVLDDLFKALLHKLMTGEVRVGDLNLSALTPPEKAEAAA